MSRIGAAFDAGRAEFLAWSPVLWEPLGERLSAAAEPRPGERVLDACCGTGASAIPAARLVGPAGRVDAVDLAGGLLEHARSAAEAAGYTHLHFVEADITTWPGLGSGADTSAGNSAGYDLVQCAYGVFFLPDLDRDTARLIGLLRPGGRFATLVWQRGGMDQIPAVMMDAVRTERPELTVGEDVSQRVNTPGLLRGWLSSLGLERVGVEVVPHSVPMGDHLAWAPVVGTILRSLLDGMDPAAVERIRARYLAGLAAKGITHVDATSLLGVGYRPGGL